MAFTYRRLPTYKKCFRVFHLSTPGIGGASNTLSGHFSIVYLDDVDHLVYEALSYCWEGSIEPSCLARLSVDAQQLAQRLVTDNDGVVMDTVVGAVGGLGAGVEAIVVDEDLNQATALQGVTPNLPAQLGGKEREAVEDGIIAGGRGREIRIKELQMRVRVWRRDRARIRRVCGAHV